MFQELKPCQLFFLCSYTIEFNTSIHLSLGLILELQLQATKQEKAKENYQIEYSHNAPLLQLWRNLYV